MSRALLSLLVAITLTACGQAPTPTPAPGGGAPKADAKAAEAEPAKAAEPAPAAAAPVAKHPWGSFKAGSFAKMKAVTSMEVAGNKTETVTEMTYRLVEVTADKAILEMETKMAAMPEPTKTRTELPLTAVGTAVEATPAPDAPKPVEGEEEITVAGKTLKCKTMEITTTTDAGKATTKTWMSEEVPGFAVKSVMTMEGAMPTTTTTELVEYQAM